LKFLYLNQIHSTQLYLVELIKNNAVSLPICVWSEYQTRGIGSKNNKWQGVRGNLFFSFAYEKKEFDFIPNHSLSIYFGWIMKKTLNSLNSKVLLKWPNDLYLEKKVGGVITQIVKNTIICGIGINTKHPLNFSRLDINIKNDKILKCYFKLLEKKPSWDEVIEEYKKEFEVTKSRFGIDGELDFDGAIIKNNKKVYSKR